MYKKRAPTTRNSARRLEANAGLSGHKGRASRYGDKAERRTIQLYIDSIDGQIYIYKRAPTARNSARRLEANVAPGGLSGQKGRASRDGNEAERRTIQLYIDSIDR